MRFTIGFLVGAVVGAAVAAWLFAERGEVVRTVPEVAEVPRVEAEARELEPPTSVRRPAVPEPEPEVAVSSAPAREQEVEPAPVTAGNRRLTGQVLDERGDPLAGVAVEVVFVEPGAGTGAESFRRRRRARTRSNEDGSFAVAGLPDSALQQVKAEREGFEFPVHRDLRPPFRPLTIRGTALVRVPVEVVREDGSAPTGDVWIQLDGTSNGSFPWSGESSFVDVPPGRYEAVAVARESIEAGDRHETSVDVASSEPRTLVAERNASPTTTKLVLRQRTSLVVELSRVPPRGDLLEDVELVVVPLDEGVDPAERLIGASAGNGDTLDRGGIQVFGDLEPGPHAFGLVWARGRGAPIASSIRTLELKAGLNRTRVELPEPEDLDLVSVHVVAATGEPVTDCALSVSWTMHGSVHFGGAVPVVAEGGTYRFPFGVLANGRPERVEEPFSVAVTSPEHGRVVGELTATERDLHLRYELAGTLRVHLRGDTGRAEGATVSLVAAGRPLRGARELTAGGGSVDFGVVQPGAHRLWVEATEGALLADRDSCSVPGRTRSRSTSPRCTSSSSRWTTRRSSRRRPCIRSTPVRGVRRTTGASPRVAARSRTSRLATTCSPWTRSPVASA